MNVYSGKGLARSAFDHSATNALAGVILVRN